MSLFDVENQTTMPPVRDMTVGPVTTSDIEEFTHRYHYTQTGGSALWRYGLWNGVVLLGVVAYNLPVRNACESVFGPDHYDKVWHMGRLALADNAPHNSESRLIGGSLRHITRDHPNTWGILTYAATDRGHIGYVYQATNAHYTGTSPARPYYIDARGRRHSDYLSGHVSPARAASLGWIGHDGDLKHRYLYILGNRTQRRHRHAQLRLPIYPYPKDPS